MVIISCVIYAAKAGDEDFKRLSLSITFIPGSGDSALMCPSVSILSDEAVEGVEDFTLRLALVTSGTSLSLGNSATAVSITDIDGKPILLHRQKVERCSDLILGIYFQGPV